jgi:excisionase family DNA binding protein
VNIPDKRYFRPDEVAEILDQPLRTIYYWLQMGMIKHLRLGRKIVVQKEEIERILRLGL